MKAGIYKIYHETDFFWIIVFATILACCTYDCNRTADREHELKLKSIEMGVQMYTEGSGNGNE